MVCEAIFAPRVSPELKSGKTFDDPLSTEEFRRVATPHAVTKSGEDVRTHRLKIPYFALQNALAFVDASLIVFSSVVGGRLYRIVDSGEVRSGGRLFGTGLIAALLYVQLPTTTTTAICYPLTLSDIM